jgi:hypothetical protein
VEPVRERDGIDHTGVVGNPRRVLGVLDADSQRLLAEHMLAGLHERHGVRNVGGVRRTNVNDLGLALRDLLDAAVCLFDPPVLGDFARALSARGHHSKNLSSGEDCRPPVHVADHSRAQNRYLFRRHVAQTMRAVAMRAELVEAREKYRCRKLRAHGVSLAA